MTFLKKKYKDFKLDSFILRVEPKNRFDIYGGESSCFKNGDKHGKSECVVSIRRLCNMIIWTSEKFYNEHSDKFEESVNLNIQYCDNE